MNAAQWKTFLSALDSWVRDHGGSAVVPPDAVVTTSSGTSYQLGAVSQEVLELSRAGELSDARADSLTALLRPEFNEFLERLDTWVAETGNASPGQHDVFTQPDGSAYPIGRRVSSYRERYKLGDLSFIHVLALERRRGWHWSFWHQRVEDLRHYVEEHGSVAGLRTHDPVLFRWLVRQRKADLSDEQRRMLEQIPGALAARTGPEGFAEALTRWLEDEPGRTLADLRTATTFDTGAAITAIGKQASYYRSRYRTGKLIQDTIDIISQIPGWTWPKD